ncbi:unnamed protein product [Gulo gulo]|uniref:Uncharacterized protein n=1 Tax=Gulo gulo TaxID=48420 RepID=A0A9X9QAH9_GULGU|nr:unnamed protein product [Gulo gulo]
MHTHHTQAPHTHTTHHTTQTPHTRHTHTTHPIVFGHPLKISCRHYNINIFHFC